MGVDIKVKKRDNDNPIISEHDIVVVTVGSDQIPVKTEGTVVHLFGYTTAFIVEFIIDGKSYVETVVKDEDNK